MSDVIKRTVPPVEQLDETWKPVPGLPYTRDELLVSNKGRVRIKGCRSALGPPQPGALTRNGYYNVQVQGQKFHVHDLICTSFHGPKPAPEYTANHKNHDPADNRACNLEWASKREQAMDQSKAKPNATGKPIFSRPVQSDGEWTEHVSTWAASIALNVSAGNIVHVANGTNNTTQTGGYVFKWAPPREAQEDLPAEGTKPPEQWKDASPVLRVSNRGRVQTKTRSNTFGHRRTPAPRQRHLYPAVRHLGKTTNVHQLVYALFGERALKPRETIDHIDQVVTNNSVDNLRPLLPAEQNRNQTFKPKAERNLSRKNPVRGKPTDGSLDWETFLSQTDAMHVLNARYSDTRFHDAAISRTVRGLNTQHAGWLFEYV